MDRFRSEERSPSNHWIGSLVGASAGLGGIEKKKSLNLDFDPSVVQPITRRYTDCAIHDATEESTIGVRQVTYKAYIGFEVLTTMNLKCAFFWVVTPCISETSRSFGAIYCLNYRGEK